MFAGVKVKGAMCQILPSWLSSPKLQISGKDTEVSDSFPSAASHRIKMLCKGVMLEQGQSTTS